MALFTKMQQDHTLALANLATETQSDRTSVVLLTKTITDITTHVSTLTAKLSMAHSKNVHMKNWDIVWSHPSTDIVHPVIRLHSIKIRFGTAMYI